MYHSKLNNIPITVYCPAGSSPRSSAFLSFSIQQLALCFYWFLFSRMNLYKNPLIRSQSVPALKINYTSPPPRAYSLDERQKGVECFAMLGWVATFPAMIISSQFGFLSIPLFYNILMYYSASSTNVKTLECAQKCSVRIWTYS